MDYLELGDKIDYDTYNGLVYLLRKFKRLTSDLKISKTISSDYGDYTITGGLTSVGGNFILEDDVTISSTNVLRNCFYTFSFTVIDVNLSGTVNKRIVKVTGDTGDNGVLEVVLEPSLLESDEVLLPDFKVDIVFDPHEYYTPVSLLDITLESDKRFVSSGEVATVTATVLDGTGEPLEGFTLQFNVNGVLYSRVTDENGQIFYEYTGTGVSSRIEVSVSGESLTIYDTPMIATVTGGSVRLGKNMVATGDILIDWGDGTTITRQSGNKINSSHTYNDGLNEHTICFVGEITSIGEHCFINCTGLTSVIIPNSVTSLGKSCFYNCTGLTSVIIPNSVTSLGEYCFYSCSSLVDYQLYWTGNDIITYDSNRMPNNTNTVFTIPYSQTSNYTGKNYPSSKLVERDAPIHTYSLSIASDKSSILTTESVTITGTLLMDSSGYSGQSIQLYDGSTLVDTLTTDSNGEYSKTISGLTAGTHTFKAVNSNAESSTVSVTVTEPTPVHDYSLSVASSKDVLSYADSESATITATLTDNSVAVAGETLNYVIKHGSTTIDSGSDTTDSNGEISFTYSATGVGDVTVEVDYGIFLQETYELEDCIRYDDASTDKSSDYSYSNLNSFSYVTDHYEANRTLGTAASTYYSPIYIDDTLPTDYEISVDILRTNNPSTSSLCQDGISIASNHPTTYQNQTEFGLLCNSRRLTVFSRNNGTGSFKNDNNNNVSANNWYTYILKVQGTTVTGIIKEGNTIKYSDSMTVSFAQSHKKWSLICGENAHTFKFKNLRIKAL